MTRPEQYLVAVKGGLIDRNVRVPGSKSIANRALICAALSRGATKLTGLPGGDDTAAMIDALDALGSSITMDGDVARIDAPIDLDRTEPLALHARLAGTTARFLTALGALRAGPVTVDGEQQLRARPMEDLHRALADLGAVISWKDASYCLPVTVQRGVCWQRQVAISTGTSSQFVSALMMIGPMIVGGLRIDLEGELVSRPYMEMTATVMASFGATVEFVGDRSILVGGGGYQGCDYRIEPDASAASYPLAAAAVVGGRLTVEGLSLKMIQGDCRFIDLLRQMGCEVVVGDNGATLTRKLKTGLKGIDLDMSEMSDLVPSLAVVAMFATTPTRIRNVGFIRRKESDRIGDLANEMRALGANVIEHEDGLEIVPSPLHGGRCDTHHDHRLAMTLGVAGLVVEGVVINNPEVVTKSWPGYWEMLESL